MTAPASVAAACREAVLGWYDATGRALAFRATRDPYAILVSELMAQQTQAERAAEAWTAWMERFPTVRALADATAADVLRAWAGLGYNRRAIALHRAARTIVEQHGGLVPDSVDALEALPGVGSYTARAVAAIAFGRPVGAVDVNVRRVLGRVTVGGSEAFTPSAMQALADAVVPPGRAGDWTHALMDVGARLCRPTKPRCTACPAVSWCRYAAGVRPDPDFVPGPVRPQRPAERPIPFPATNRWLRGRILDRAREVDGDDWVAYPDAIGSHSAAAVREAVRTLAREGLLEARDTPAGPEARLPA